MGRPGSQSAILLSISAQIAALVLSPSATAQKSRKVAAKAPASDSGPTLTFTQIFKSSYPEYVQITVKQDGTGAWDIRQ